MAQCGQNTEADVQRTQKIQNRMENKALGHQNIKRINFLVIGNQWLLAYGKLQKSSPEHNDKK